MSNKNDIKAKQIRAILDFRSEVSRKTGKRIPLSEAIRDWIITGEAEKFRNEFFNL